MPHDDDSTRDCMTPDGQQQYNRYQFTTTADDQVLLYDVHRETAWLQSSDAVSLDAYR